MTTEELRATISVAGYRVKGGSILDIADAEEVIAAQSRDKGYVFAALKLKNGKVAAVWETHAVVAGSLEEMFGNAEHDPVLNNHERTLVTYGVK